MSEVNGVANDVEHANYQEKHDNTSGGTHARDIISVSC